MSSVFKPPPPVYKPMYKPIKNAYEFTNEHKPRAYIYTNVRDDKNMDDGKLNTMVFLDVRKAFDSINHKILLGKMCNLFGVTESSNKWLIIKSENDNM